MITCYDNYFVIIHFYILWIQRIYKVANLHCIQLSTKLHLNDMRKSSKYYQKQIESSNGQIQKMIKRVSDNTDIFIKFALSFEVDFMI